MGRSYIKLLKLCFLKLEALGTSLVVLWLRLCSPNAEGPDLIPGQGTRSHMLKALYSWINKNKIKGKITIKIKIIMSYHNSC